MLKIDLSLKHFSVIITIFGIILLYIMSTMTQPVAISIHEISKYDGKQITTSGIVIDHYKTTYGSQIITIKEDNETVKIFLEGETPIEIGDKIQATGEVQKYKDEWEIIVNNKKFIKIIQKWDSNHISISQLSKNPERYKDLNLNVTGYIDSLYDDYFILTDSGRKHSILVKYQNLKNTSTFKNNQVNICGRFIFDTSDFRYKLLISDEKHGIFFSTEGR